MIRYFLIALFSNDLATFREALRMVQSNNLWDAPELQVSWSFAWALSKFKAQLETTSLGSLRIPFREQPLYRARTYREFHLAEDAIWVAGGELLPEYAQRMEDACQRHQTYLDRERIKYAPVGYRLQ